MSADVYMITFGIIFCCLLLLPIVCKLSLQAGLCSCLMRDKSLESITGEEGATCTAQRPLAGVTVESRLANRAIASRPGCPLPVSGGAGSSQAASGQVPRSRSACRCAQQMPPPPYTVACHLVQPGTEHISLGDRQRERRKIKQHKPAKASSTPLTPPATPPATTRTSTATTTVSTTTTTHRDVSRDNLSPTPLQSRLRLLRLPYHASPPPVYQEREESAVPRPEACPPITGHHQLPNGPHLATTTPVADLEVSTCSERRSLQRERTDLISGSVPAPESSSVAGNSFNVEPASPSPSEVAISSLQTDSVCESFSSNACVMARGAEESAAAASVGETVTEASNSKDRLNANPLARTLRPQQTPRTTLVLLQAQSSSLTEPSKSIPSSDESLTTRKLNQNASTLSVSFREAEVNGVEAKTVRTPCLSPALQEGSSSPYRHRGTANDGAEKARDHDLAHLVRCGSVRKKLMLFQDLPAGRLCDQP